MTPMLLSAFWTYTLITALTPGPNNILALSAATAHGFRQSIRVLAGMSLGFLVVMLLCAGSRFPLRLSIRQSFICSVGWGLRISCGWRGKLLPVQRRMRTPDQNRLAFGKLWSAVCERQNYSVRHYRSVYICFTANAGAELGHRRQYIAGIDRHVR